MLNAVAPGPAASRGDRGDEDKAVRTVAAGSGDATTTDRPSVRLVYVYARSESVAVRSPVDERLGSILTKLPPIAG